MVSSWRWIPPRFRGFFRLLTLASASSGCAGAGPSASRLPVEREYVWNDSVQGACKQPAPRADEFQIERGAKPKLHGKGPHEAYRELIPRIHACIHRKKVEGKLYVAFSVDCEGKVRAVRASIDGLEPNLVVDCVLTGFTKLRFGPQASGPVVENLTLNLQWR